MCGRFALYAPHSKIHEFFDADVGALEFAARYNIAPMQVAPVIRQRPNGERVAHLLRWGLIPSWSKDDKIAQHTFNALAETIAEKPSFRAAFKRRRCIVPVSAFFEWRAIPGEKKKQKLRFSSPDAAPLAIAGLWESWTPPDTGETVESYTIITTSANEFMAPSFAYSRCKVGPRTQHRSRVNSKRLDCWKAMPSRTRSRTWQVAA